MSTVEREYIKSVDDVILKASGKTLKKTPRVRYEDTASRKYVL